MTTGIPTLDRIERATRQYLRCKAQAKRMIDNVALHISAAPMDKIGSKGSNVTSKVELGAMMSCDAELKAMRLQEELNELRKTVKPYIWQMPPGNEKTAVRMYYLRGQGLAAIGRTLGKRTGVTFTPDAAIAALERGILWLKKNTKIK